MNKKIIFPLLTASVLTALAAGCANGSGGGSSTKATLEIATLDKGIGTDWLENAARMFEDLYKDSTDFQEGKTGVEIKVIGSTSYDGAYLENNALNKDIYFTEGIAYRELVKKNKFMDLTPVMTASLTDYGEDKTILSKLDQEMETYLNMDGKYYGIPFYDSFYGLVYDVSLWNEKKLYISKTGTFVNKNGNLSLGTDNIEGTLDDGLPSTYEEFASLLKEISDKNITPFVCSTNGVEYTANFLFNVFSDYEGLDNMNLTLSLDGVANDLVATNGISVDEHGNETITYKPATTITEDNGYELTRQVGRYKALSFMNDILLSSKKNYSQVATHTVAQQTFVYGKSAQNPVAMIVEGSWWENEAKTTISNYQKTYGERSDYAIMPVPFANAEKAASCGYKHTYLSLSQSFGIISSTSKNQKLAYEFMKFLHTDKMLSKFTADTSITRPLNYTVSEEDASKLSTYAKSLINLKQTADIFYPYSASQFQIDYPRLFNAFNWAWNTRINGYDYQHPWQYFVGGPTDENRTALKYFDGQYDYFSAKWPK